MMNKTRGYFRYLDTEKKERNLKELFGDDGHVFVVPMEHLERYGREPVDWVKAAEGVIAGGADAICTVPALLKKYHKVLIDRIPVLMTTPIDLDFLDYAAKMGCNGVKTGFYGPPLESIDRDLLEKFALRCDELGLTFCWEPIPFTKGYYSDLKREPDNGPCNDVPTLQRVVYTGMMWGADYLKIEYTGDSESMKQVTKYPIPITIHGYEKIPARNALERLKSAMEGGVIGAYYGRNVYFHENPEAMTRALVKVIHENATVEQAMKELEG